MRVPAQLDKAPERSVQRCGLNPERPAYRPRRAACATGGAAARIDLAAQPAHRDRDRVGFRVLALEDGQLHAPDLFSELPGIVDLARPLHQEGQQGEFLGRQPQDLAIANDPAAQQVQLQVREMQAVAGLRRRIEHGAGHACRPAYRPARPGAALRPGTRGAAQAHILGIGDPVFTAVDIGRGLAAPEAPRPARFHRARSARTSARVRDCP